MIGAGARLRDRAALDLPPQELLLSRQPEGLPDQPVRHPAVPRRPARRRPHPPRPPRGGRGEADPRRRVGPHPRLRRLAGRLQPRRHAAGRDRHRARPARAAEQAREWLRLLRTTLRQLGVSDVNMEEGALRCDANVSVRPAGSEELGTKTELKNMNSLPLPRARDRGRDRAPGASCSRRGGRSCRRRCTSTPAPARSRSLRSKEEAHDYRYFPEPDLVPLAPTEEMLREAARGAAGAAGGADRALRARARPAADTARAARLPTPSSATTSSRRCGRGRRRRAAGRSPTG